MKPWKVAFVIDNVSPTFTSGQGCSEHQLPTFVLLEALLTRTYTAVERYRELSSISILASVYRSEDTDVGEDLAQEHPTSERCVAVWGFGS